MPTCELRAPTLDDVDAVYALICELKQKAYDRRHFTAGFAMNLQNPTLRYQLAQVEGETVGLIGLQLQFPLNFNAWIGEVQELVVLPQRRGLHVGQALLAWAEQEAREHGAQMVELSSGKARPDAHRFYLREGYTQSHLRFKKSAVRRKYGPDYPLNRHRRRSWFQSSAATAQPVSVRAAMRRIVGAPVARS